ncbi:uncharacterized protein LOC143356999 [Halictus rubicundus]|uniref:uncharacterized protein LOC143356999 n=1 Tax=Halictus rubicundus TaxID=77578 RepID=UPI0040369BB2
MKVSQTRVDANGWCRLCLCDKVSSRPIFAKGAAFERLRSIILDCCPITLFDDDHLPKSICHRCENKLDIAYQFRQLCRESERVLRARYESSFRERSDVLRVSGVRTTEADKRTKVSKDPRNRCPRSPRTDRAKPSPGYQEIVRHNGEDEDVDEAGTGKRKEPTVSRSEEKGEERESVRQRLESETRTSKHGRSGEPEDEDQGSRSRSDPVTEPVTNQTSFSTGDASGTNGTSATEKKFLCDACSKTFASKSGLRFHSKTHIGAKPHACRHCGKRFAIPSYAKRHERIHTAEKQFICHVCSASFASSNGLRYHLRAHTGEANYRCETCGKSFCRYKYLKEHRFTHTGEKPFVCKSCGVAYASSGSLFVHEKKCGRKTSVHQPDESPA